MNSIPSQYSNMVYIITSSTKTFCCDISDPEVKRLDANSIGFQEFLNLEKCVLWEFK